MASYNQYETIGAPCIQTKIRRNFGPIYYFRGPNLYHQHGLPERFVIVGCGRTRLTDREFRSKLETALPASDSSGLDGWQNFARRLFYQTIDYDDRLSYVQLADTLKSQDKKNHAGGNLIFYLAKETVQNVLMFRFANAIFEPVWNRRYIEYVSINAMETLGVGHRAGYYEQAGVLRDMFQNHMMQLLALIAMEPPARFKAEQVRDERIKVFRSLRPFSTENMADHLVLGQYGSGRIDGKKIQAYREETGVDPGSLTPTFARMKVFLDNWRWQGVPFYLTSGKRLAEKMTEISIQFKDVPHSMFRKILGETISANRITLGIYPDEKITLTFQTKQPGARVCLRPVTMNFDYHRNESGPVLEAYEKVLLDCILGDHMLFWRQDGVERCWWFLTPILAACENCEDRGRKLHFYQSGSWGSEEAADIGPGDL